MRAAWLAGRRREEAEKGGWEGLRMGRLWLRAAWRLTGRGCCGKQQRDQAKQKGMRERKCCNSCAEPSGSMCLFDFPIVSGIHQS